MFDLFTADNVTIDLSREGESFRVVEGASFALEAGKIYDLVGPSGSGKSTLLRACCLMLETVSGCFRLRGKAASDYTPEEWRRHVCLVPQKPALVPGTVRQNLLLPWTLRVRKGESKPCDFDLLSYLKAARLDDVALDRDISQLSGGQVARVALLRSFVTRPAVLLLDEVDAALDSESSAAVSALTASAVNGETTCLRIRHRATDGLAAATFEIREGKLSMVAQSTMGEDRS